MRGLISGIVFLAGLLMGCAGSLPISQGGALPQLPLADLIANVDGYVGQTVVMGGYVLEVENRQHTTRIVAVQVPIGSGQRLKSKDLSEGRLILIYDGFIDPEVYTKGRGITLRGEILGGGANDPEVAYPYLRIKVRDIYLWPEEKLTDPDDRLDDALLFPWWWYRHYPYGRYPYYWDPYWYYRYRK